VDRRVLIAALIAIAVLAAAAGGVWAWLSRGGPRPEVEVIVAEAAVKVGEETVATARKGDRLSVYGKRVGWYQVKAGGELGWIHAANVRRVRDPDAPPRLVEAEVLAVFFPDVVLDEFPPSGERWLLVEVNAYAAKANAEGGTAIDTLRFVALHGQRRFFRPRVWKKIQVGDHAIERLEIRDEFVLPVGSSRKLRLAYTIPSDLVARTGWHVLYVPPKAKGASSAPDTADGTE